MNGEDRELSIQDEREGRELSIQDERRRKRTEYTG